MSMDQPRRGKLDPMQKARDFLYTSRPRVRPISSARKLDKIARQAQEAVTVASIGGAGGSVAIFDALPDPTSEDVSNIIYVAGAVGQPARGYMGVQTQNDTVIWEPIFTQGFYGAATEHPEEFYSDHGWTFSGSSSAGIDGGNGHPGTRQIVTGNTSLDQASFLLSSLRLVDIERAAFIFRTWTTLTSVAMRVGFGTSVFSPNNGLYVEKETGDTNWFLAKAVGTVETRADSGISATVTSNWFLFQIARTGTAGEFQLTLTDLTGTQGATETVVTGLTETALVAAFFWVQTHTAAGRRLDVDYFWLRNRATVRS